MERLKYSILMSVYHKEKPEWLITSIDSMLKQTVKADQFVIVKDGELTEGLDRVIESYNNQYPELFTIIRIPNNVGLGPALKIGLKYCKNELVARMDSDDYSCPKRCEKQLQVFENHPEYDAVGCFEAEFENNIDNIISIHKVPEESHEIYNFMKRRCALLHPTVMYKKSAIIKCGGYKDVRLYEDYDLFMRLVIEEEAKCYNIQENLYYIRINNDFFKRRGGISYMKTAIKFKFRQCQKGYIAKKDFIISAGSQMIVCMLPNKVRKSIYLNFLRE